MDKVDYAVWQVEKGSHEHIQMYIHVNTPVRFSYFKALLPGAHFEKSNGTPQQNRTYCTKEETRIRGPWEYGTCPGGQGERNDLNKMLEDVKKRKSDLELANDYGMAFFRNEKYIKRARDLYGIKHWNSDNCVMKVILHIGETGCGKTHDALHMESSYLKPKLDWFDGYNNEKVIVFDEFVGQYSYEEMKIYCDKYEDKLPVKGGFVNRNYDTVVICSNKHPSRWWPDIGYDHMKQFRRRVTTIKYYYEFKKYIEIPNNDEFWNSYWNFDLRNYVN